MRKTEKFDFLTRHVSAEQCKDMGMVTVLLCLVIGLTGQNQLFFKIGLGVLLIDIIWPKIFFPVAVVWFGFGNAAGGIISKVGLTIIFFLVVTPLGFLKRRTGSEPLRLREWKQSRTSVFAVRDRRYCAHDLEKPY